MNKYILSSFACAMLMCAVASCDTAVDAPEVSSGEMREITVSVEQTASRTTIEYENVDLSHLVWQNGDRVAYVTDYPGDVCRVATVSSNRFTATVPTGATSDNQLIVVWPVGDNEGRTLSEVCEVLSDVADCDVDKPFDGSRLPMIARLAVPEGNTVDAGFDMLGSVVRLSVNPYNHESERLLSVSLKADQNLTGTLRWDGDGMAFDGTSNQITASVSGSDVSLRALSGNNGYVYLPVARDEYTGVTLTVTTDAGTYTFSDGRMNLARAGRTLYKLDVAIDKPDPVDDPIYRYMQISSMDEVTTGEDDSYLIVCKAISRLFGGYNSGNYPDGLDVMITSSGMIDPAQENVSRLAFTLSENPDIPGEYSLSCPGFRSGYRWIGCMANYSEAPGRIAVHKESQFDDRRDYWRMSFDEAGNVILKANPTFDTVVGEWWMAFYYPGMCFCTTTDGVLDMLDIQLFKLVRVQ